MLNFSVLNLHFTFTDLGGTKGRGKEEEQEDEEQEEEIQEPESMNDMDKEKDLGYQDNL